MERTIVKIDLCGSKQQVDDSPDRTVARQRNLESLIAAVRNHFPEADTPFPEGTYYRSEGDATYLILDSPVLAVRCAMELSQDWFSSVEQVPDCRIILATGAIRAVNEQEYFSDTFENVSAAEKLAGPGEILIDRTTTDKLSSGLFQFDSAVSIEVTRNRTIEFYPLLYRDPRLSRDAALVHAVFVAPRQASTARARTYEVLAIEALEASRDSQMESANLFAFFQSRGVPSPGEDSLERMLASSPYLTVKNNGDVSLSESGHQEIGEWRTRYEQSRQEAIEAIAAELGQEVGLQPHVVLDRMDLPQLVTDYLNTIFADVRMMAAFFESTNQFFEHLSRPHRHDAILRRYMRGLQVRSDLFGIYKKCVLNSLRELSRLHNAYVGAVFHSALLSYYLNTNPRYSSRQIDMLRNKRVFLDTNALYAYLVEASEYHRFLRFAISRLIAMGVEVSVFDKSVEEYNDSLLNALARANRDRGFGLQFADDRPWIWQEFVSDTTKYRNDFEICVRWHTVPQRIADRTEFSVERASERLAEHGIRVAKLEPFLDAAGLGELYGEVAHAKQRRIIDSEGYPRWEAPDGAEFKVLHDANCLHYLATDGESPYDTPHMFVTADFRLARVRKRRAGYAFLATVTEFQEFITPYLLMSQNDDNLTWELPRIFLAASVDLQLADAGDLYSQVGKYLSNENLSEEYHDFVSSFESHGRFAEIAERLRYSEEVNDRRAVAEARSDLVLETAKLDEELKHQLGTAIAQELLNEKDGKIESLRKQLEDTTQRLAISEKKRKGKERYERSQQRKRRDGG